MSNAVDSIGCSPGGSRPSPDRALGLYHHVLPLHEANDLGQCRGHTNPKKRPNNLEMNVFSAFSMVPMGGMAPVRWGDSAQDAQDDEDVPMRFEWVHRHRFSATHADHVERGSVIVAGPGRGRTRSGHRSSEVGRSRRAAVNRTMVACSGGSTLNPLGILVVGRGPWRTRWMISAGKPSSGPDDPVQSAGSRHLGSLRRARLVRRLGSVWK
jgi:hypothetical protein